MFAFFPSDRGSCTATVNIEMKRVTKALKLVWTNKDHSVQKGTTTFRVIGSFARSRLGLGCGNVMLAVLPNKELTWKCREKQAFTCNTNMLSGKMINVDCNQHIYFIVATMIHFLTCSFDCHGPRLKKHFIGLNTCRKLSQQKFANIPPCLFFL